MKEEHKMKEYKHICKSEAEAQEWIRSFRKAGYKRTQNAYWVEWFENGEERHIVERDF